MINFPNNPSFGDAFTLGGTIYTCVSTSPIVWNASPAAAAIPDAPTDGKTYGRNTAAWKALDKTDVGLNNVDNTADVNKPVSAPQSATFEPKIVASVVANYWRGDKTWQPLNKAAAGLGNVDNTADAAKTVRSALYLRAGANPAGAEMMFNWSDDGSQPTYLWGGTSSNGLVYLTSRVKTGSAGYADNAGYSTNSGQVSGVGGWAYRNDANNPAYLWCTEGDAQAQHLTQPGALSVGYANNAHLINGIQIEWRDPGAYPNYVVCANSPTDSFIRPPSALSVNYANSCDYANRVGTINNATGGYVNGSINAQVGYLGRAGVNGGTSNQMNTNWSGSFYQAYVDSSFIGNVSMMSDERIKHSVAVLPEQHDGFMKIVPISYRFKDISIWKDDGIDHWGWSAQNMAIAIPKAIIGDFESLTKDGDIQPAGVDDRPILALTVLEVQALWNEVVSLRERIAALEA